MRHEHYGCCIFYEDGPELLEQSLKAMKAIGLKVIAIDGAYQEFMKWGQIEKPYSTDGCIDVAKTVADIYVPCPAEGWLDQPTKRNEYVKMTPEGDYFWAIDADEVMRPCRLNFDVEKDVYRIMENRFRHEEAPGVSMSTIRTYKKYPDIGYKYQHSRIYRLNQHKEDNLDSGLVVQASNVANYMKPLLKDLDGNLVTLDHYNYKRSLERKRQKQNFYRMREEAKYPW